MHTVFSIGDRRVGGDHPCYLIAEGCDNHLGNTDTACEMILQAKLAGADAIKFQHHIPDEEMLPDVPMSNNFDMPLYEFLKKYALTLEQHVRLKQFADKVGIQYLCTPFSLKAARELESAIGLPAYKIGSGEMTDIPSLVRIGEFKKPMIISTGMATFEEIDRTYNVLTSRHVPLSLMNCVSEYPPIYEDINLGVIRIMRERYPEAIIGHSDHSPDIYTCFAAVALGAKLLEKHVILDKRQPGPDQAVSIDFRELAQLVDGVRKIEAAMGDERKVQDRERPIREWAFRSLISTRRISAGELIGDEMVWSKRPGTGIPSWRMDEVIGKRAARDIEANVLLRWDDFE
jgi:sialic acid synthase SpsE